MAARDEGEGIKRRGRRVGVEVLLESVRCDCSEVGGECQGHSHPIAPNA